MFFSPRFTFWKKKIACLNRTCVSAGGRVTMWKGDLGWERKPSWKAIGSFEMKHWHKYSGIKGNAEENPEHGKVWIVQLFMLSPYAVYYLLPNSPGKGWISEIFIALKPWHATDWNGPNALEIVDLSVFQTFLGFCISKIKDQLLNLIKMLIVP